MLSADVHVEIGMSDVHASGGLLQHAVLLWLSDRDGRQRDGVDCGSIADSFDTTFYYPKQIAVNYVDSEYRSNSDPFSASNKNTHCLALNRPINSCGILSRLLCLQHPDRYTELRHVRHLRVPWSNPHCKRLRLLGRHVLGFV